MKEEGEKRDPVAGKSLREDKKDPTTISIAAKDKRAPALARCFGGPTRQRLLG
jgi:hypothetical protein